LYLLRGEKLTFKIFVRQILNDAKKFLNLPGIIVVLFVSLLSPILGLKLSLGLTQELYLPNFIASVIAANPVYNLCFNLLSFVLFIIAWFNSFIFHAVIIDHDTIAQAAKRSYALIKKHWKNFIWEGIRFTTHLLLVQAALIFLWILIAIVAGVATSWQIPRVLIIFWSQILRLGVTLNILLAMPFYIMHLTRLYYTYRHQIPFVYRPPKKQFHPWMWTTCVSVTALCALTAWYFDKHFDEFFSPEVNVQIVAHRGGGILDTENTAAGMREAIAHGVLGSEFDIQRTKDGVYAVNHDVTFARMADDQRRSYQITWPEMTQLHLHDAHSKQASGEPVSRVEQMLDTARGHIIPFVELKGETADVSMAEDVIAMLRERDMLDQAYLISLDYHLVDYIENHYPDALTGHTISLSFGDTASLNTDYLLIEEEIATDAIIDAIHAQGKKVMIWTVNSEPSMRYFLQTDADAILTDRVEKAQRITKQLEERSEFDMIFDRIFRYKPNYAMTDGDD